MFVPKKSGELRLCVDYRALNRVTEKNRYPLPLISEILDRLSGAKYFTKLDLKDAFHRIRIREGDEWKTAFRTRYGHFEYLVMPFRLTNAPATFQSYIHQALHGLLDEFCIAYVDDILIFSSDRDSHTKHVRIVLERLEQSQLFINPSKCSFYQDRLHFLGFVVSREGISMDPERVRAIAEWPIPRTYRDIQVFLGFCNFYRRFIYRYSSIAAPLNHLLKGSVREASYNCFVIDRSAESGGSSKLYSTVVSLLSYRRLILRMLATCSFPMSSHMYLCTTCCTERWLWSTMPSMDCRKGFIPGLMRGFEGFLLQGFPESPWGYVPRIVH